jgi:arylsulfatase A-like enzyme
MMINRKRRLETPHCSWLKSVGALAILCLVEWAGSCDAGAALSEERPARPNVLFICVDDWNDWVGCLGHRQAKTPHVDRLARHGILFTNAHCAAPVCNPSRVATLSGKRPDATGVYNNSHVMRNLAPDVMTLPQYFRAHGYHAAGGGKVFHDVPPHCHDPASWDEYFWWNEHGPRGGKHQGHWRSPYSIFPDPEPVGRPTRQITSLTKRNFDWGPVEQPVEAWPDYQVTDWAADFLQLEHQKPFFLAVGIFRPHVPWFNPPEYFDRFPVNEIELPIVKADDTTDLGAWGRKLALDRTSKHDKVVSFGEWKSAVRAYLASIAFADDNVGRVLDALDHSRYRDNTVIVFWSDHGYHLGEKGHWHKQTLWERSTRVPLIFAGYGIFHASARCGEAVNLLDLYPTLLELCQLPPRPDLDGQSLTPLLENPNAARAEPSVTTYLAGNHAVRNERWRYIRYVTGEEELYDHQSDPHEWDNLAGEAQLAEVIQQMRRYLPHTKEATP